MTVAATTELEAINVMLSAVGEAPINSLTGTLPVDARQAQSFLNEASKEIQSEGWSFNYEYDVVLTRDAGNSVALPTNVLRVDVSVANHPDIDPVQRGLKLYDRKNHTFSFTEDLKAEIVYFLAFDELPEPARRYINLKAARVFIDRVLGDDGLRGYTQQDEVRARAVLLDSDASIADHNVLTGDPAISGRFGTFMPHKELIR